MPTYGYRCTECGVEFERFQKISDPALTECDTCGGAVKKLLYPVGIQFKGSGFYVNDYAKKSSGGSSPGSGDSAGTASSGSTASSPAAASDAPASPAPAEGSKPAPAPAASSGASSS